MNEADQDQSLQDHAGVRPDDSAESQEPTSPKKPKLSFLKGSVGKILVVAGVLVLQFVAAYFLMTRVLLPPSERGTTEAATSEEQVGSTPADQRATENVAQEVQQAATPGQYKGGAVLPGQVPDLRAAAVYSIEDLVVNPAFSAGERYLVVSLVLVSDVKDVEEELEIKLPLIRDRLISLLAQNGIIWYSNFKNRDVLREKIRLTVNAWLETGKITHVLFTKYVIQ